MMMERERAVLRYQSKFLKLVKPSKRKGGAWKDPDTGEVGPDGKDSSWEGRESRGRRKRKQNRSLLHPPNICCIVLFLSITQKAQIKAEMTPPQRGCPDH